MRSTSPAKLIGLFTTALTLFTLNGCASSSGSMESPVVAQARDLPDHFMVTASGLSQKEEPKPGEGCRNPMVDPRNGTTLSLKRSKDGIGDYQVTGRDYEIQSAYGVDSSHLLRIDCGTGKVLGIVNQ